MKNRSVLCASAITASVVALGGWITCWNLDTPNSMSVTRQVVASGLPGSPLEVDQKSTLGDRTANEDSSPSAEEPPALPPLLQYVQAVLAQAEREGNDERREQCLEELAMQVPSHDVSAVVDFLNNQIPSEVIIGLRSRLLRLWAESDPHSAAAAALRVDGTHRQEAINSTMSAWVERSPGDALAWARRLPAEDARHETLLAIGFDVARSRPMEAIELAIELPRSPGGDELLAHAMAEWAAAAPQEAAALAHEIGDEALRAQLIGAVATALGDSDPAAAARLALLQMPPGKAQNDALVAIVQRWAQADPGAAADWVAGFPESDLRDAAMENLVKLWAGQDRHSPASWIESLPAGPGRDSALRAYAEQLAPSSPATAMAWAGAIRMGKLRETQLGNVAKLWMRMDAIAATEWLRRSSLPTETKERIPSD